MPQAQQCLAPKPLRGGRLGSQLGRFAEQPVDQVPRVQLPRELVGELYQHVVFWMSRHESQDRLERFPLAVALEQELHQHPHRAAVARPLLDQLLRRR